MVLDDVIAKCVHMLMTGQADKTSFVWGREGGEDGIPQIKFTIEIAGDGDVDEGVGA